MLAFELQQKVIQRSSIPCLGLLEVVLCSNVFSLVAVLLCTISLSSAEEARFFRIGGLGATAIIGITADGYVSWTNALTNVTCTFQTAQSLASPSNWVDYAQVPVRKHVI